MNSGKINPKRAFSRILHKTGELSMKQEQTNIVAVRTRKLITDAFLALIRERPYEEITVTEICRRADVVRKTFYNHFQAKDDVIKWLMNDWFYQLESKINLRQMSVRRILRVAFEVIIGNREALLLFYRRGLFRFANAAISAYITKDHLLSKLDEKKIDARAYRYIAAQVSAVLISVIETWIENDFAEPVDFLAELTEALMYQP